MMHLLRHGEQDMGDILVCTWVAVRRCWGNVMPTATRAATCVYHRRQKAGRAGAHKPQQLVLEPGYITFARKNHPLPMNAVSDQPNFFYVWVTQEAAVSKHL